MNSFKFPQIIPNWIDGRESETGPARRLRNFLPPPAPRSVGWRAHALQASRGRSNRPQKRSCLVGSYACRARRYGAGYHALHARKARAHCLCGQRGNRHVVEGALTETAGAIAQGEFMAGEGRRLYGRTTTSAAPNRWVMTVREPLGIAGLIIAANTPIANVAWKVFPALICGNTAVLKAPKTLRPPPGCSAGSP